MKNRLDIIETLKGTKKDSQKIEAKMESSESSIQINVFPGGTVNNVTYIVTSEIRITEDLALNDLAWPPRQRERVFRICHGIAKQYGLYKEMRAVMRERWSAESMRELTDGALQSLLSFLRAMERQRQQ